MRVTFYTVCDDYALVQINLHKTLESLTFILSVRPREGNINQSRARAIITAGYRAKKMRKTSAINHAYGIMRDEQLHYLLETIRGLSLPWNFVDVISRNKVCRARKMEKCIPSRAR